MSEQSATCPWCHHEHLNTTDCGVRILSRFSFASAAYNCACTTSSRCTDCGHAPHGEGPDYCQDMMVNNEGIEPLGPCGCGADKGEWADGDSDGAGTAAVPADGDGGVRRGSDSDVAAVAEQIARSGDKVLTEIARIRAMQDEALPLWTAERDRLRAEVGDLPMDLEKDRGDGGLGSGRWLNAENP